MSDQIKPKIDDQFWFDHSETMVKKAVERRDEAAGRIQSLIVWLWGIYTALTTVGFTLSEKHLSLWPTLIIASASAALIGVYWATVWVVNPPLGQFDPRSPDDIRDDFNMIIRVKDRRLNITLAASLAAAALVSVALIVASTAEKALPVAPTFTPSIHMVGNNAMLALTGTLPEAKEVTVHIQPDGDKSEISRTLTLLEEGILESSLPLAVLTKGYKVTVEWTTSSGTTLQVTKNITQ